MAPPVSVRRVLVVGDSHVRRLRSSASGFISRVVGPSVLVRYMSRGGSGAFFVNCSVSSMMGYDLIIVFTGGNDIRPGVSSDVVGGSIIALLDRLTAVVCPRVVFLPIWPRHSCLPQFGSGFVAEYEHHRLAVNAMVSQERPQFYIEWDHRCRVHSYLRQGDSIHLSDAGYRRAARHVVHVIQHRLE